MSDLRDKLAGHEWLGGPYNCQCGHNPGTPEGYLDHLAGLLDRNRA